SSSMSVLFHWTDIEEEEPCWLWREHGSSSSMSVQWNSTRVKRCSLPNGCSAPISPRTRLLGWHAAGRRVEISASPDVIPAAHTMGPLTLYLAGRSTEALTLAAAAADSARSSRDTTFIMYSLTHLGLNLTAVGRYAEATKVFHEARTFGRKYGAIPMLARATAMTPGPHLPLF